MVNSCARECQPHLCGFQISHLTGRWNRGTFTQTDRSVRLAPRANEGVSRSRFPVRIQSLVWASMTTPGQRHAIGEPAHRVPRFSCAPIFASRHFSFSPCVRLLAPEGLQRRTSAFSRTNDSRSRFSVETERMCFPRPQFCPMPAGLPIAGNRDSADEHLNRRRAPTGLFGVFSLRICGQDRVASFRARRLAYRTSDALRSDANRHQWAAWHCGFSR
jgi:hypothetical protein